MTGRRLSNGLTDLSRIFPGKGVSVVVVVVVWLWCVQFWLSFFPPPGVPARLPLPVCLPRIFDLTIFGGFVRGARLRVDEFLGGF